MIQVRFWLALLLLWLCVVTNIDRLVSLHDISASARIAAALLSAALLVMGWPRGVSRSWLYCASTLVVLSLRFFEGGGFVGPDFGTAAVEVGMVVVAVAMAVRIFDALAKLRGVTEEAVTLQLGAEMIAPGPGEQGIQSEIARARRFGRPLTIVTVSARGQRNQQELNEILLKAQREVIDRYVEGRLYRLLQQHVRDCDIVTRQNGQFVVVMPETDRDFAQSIIDRVQEVAVDDIGLTVNAGIASFPSEERTLVGLMDRASSEMDANLVGSTRRNTPK